MNAPAAIKGTFSDFKLIKTRKLCQIVIEVAIEQADEALLALGGLPRSDNERWVAVARLDVNAMREPLPHPMEKRERRQFCDLPYSQQAGIKSDDLTFALWMSHLPVGKECESAAEAIRAYCGVESRADIRPGTKAAERWLELLRNFEGRDGAPG